MQRAPETLLPTEITKHEILDNNHDLLDNYLDKFNPNITNIIYLEGIYMGGLKKY
jgi:hypothetical protein